MLNVVFALVLPFLADVPDEELRRLLEAGEPQQAYELAEKLADAYAGDPDFDFFYGLSAMAAGFPAEASFAFERIIMSDYGTPRVRLELARSYFILGNFDSAAEEFNRILLLNPPRNVKDKVDKFLKVIQIQKNTLKISYSGSASANGGYDSNVNSATSDSEIFSDLLNASVSLSEDSREQNDAFVGLGVQLNMIYPISQKKSITGGISIANHSNASSSGFDTNSLTVNGGYLFERGEARIRIPMTLQTFFLDGEQIRNSVASGLDWSQAYNDKTQLIYFGLLTVATNPADGTKDSTSIIGGSGATRTVNRWPINLMGSVYLGNDRYSEYSYLSKTMLGARLSLTYQKVKQHQFAFNMIFQQAVHNDDDPTFAITRKDTFIDMTFLWSWILEDNLMMTSKIQYSDNHSNLQLYDYDRIQSQIGITYRF